MSLTASDVIAILGALFGGLATLLTIWVNYRAGKVIEQNQAQFVKLKEIHEGIDDAKRNDKQVAAEALAVAKALAEKK